MNIGFASVASVDTIWPLIAKDMQKACERVNSDYTAGDLWQMCRSGNGFLAVASEGLDLFSASVWRFEGKTLKCIMLWGIHRPLWLRGLFEFVEKTALENGADRLAAEGRRGWLRLFPDAVVNGKNYEVMIDG